MSLCASPLRAESQFPTALWVSWMYAPVVFKAQHFWGYSLWCRFQMLGNWCGAQAPCSSGRIFLFVRSLLIMGHYTRGRVFGDTMSLPLLPVWMSPFYPLLWSRRSASFQVFFRGNCSICSYRFGCVHRGDEFRIFLWCHFGTASPLKILFCFVFFITYCPLFPNQWGKSATLYLRVNMIEKVSPVSYLKNKTKQK